MEPDSPTGMEKLRTKMRSVIRGKFLNRRGGEDPRVEINLNPASPFENTEATEASLVNVKMIGARKHHAL